MAAEKYNKALYKWLKEIYLRLENQDETIIFINERIDSIDKKVKKLEEKE